MKYFSLLFMLICWLETSAQRQEKPNVLFVISDDLSATAVSSYGNSAISTPNIDQLASEGITYSKAYSNYPVCGPSRASMLFGYYPNATKTYGYVSGRENVGPEKKSWPQLFKENGYYTARVGKIFHMGTKDILKGKNGADDKISWTERFNSQDPQWTSPGEGELVQNNPFNLKPPKQGNNLMSIIKAEGSDLDYADGRSAHQAVKLIRENKDKPFFLSVGFIRPHVPFVAPKSYFSPFPYQQILLPPKVQNDWDDIPSAGINYVTSVNGQMSEEQQQKAIAAYYASVSYMDAQLGVLLNALKEEGLEENTIVIFTSDHGFHLGEHDFWMKVGLHEESVRVPLIIKVPGNKPAVCNSLAELIDLYPTIADLAGIKTSPHLQGESLVKTIDDPTYEVREMAFSMNTRNNRKAFLARTEKWAYIQYGRNAEEGIELYDMEHDPKQYNNLAQIPKYSKIVRKLRKELRKKITEIKQNDLDVNYSD